MVVGMSCTGGRLAGSAKLSRQFALRPHPRLISSIALQHARTTFPRAQHSLPQSFRSYWWSSSKAPALVPEATVSPLSPVLPADAAVDTVSAASPLVEETPVIASPVEPSAAVDSASVTDIVSVPDVPSEALANISPLQYGDLAALGLSGYSPAGLCRWGIEIIQVSTGMPWFWTIISATFLSRVILFPFQIKSMQNTARLAPHQPQINALREDMVKAKETGDPLEMQKSMLKQRMLYEKIGVSMGSMMLMPFIQLPVTLGMFFGVKGLCDLPLAQLRDSGFSWLPDLTVADPTYILPIAATVAMNLQLSLSMRDMTATPAVPHMVNLFRVLSLASVYFLGNLPSGVVVYLIASLGAMTLQSAILRIPAIRLRLGIPIIPKESAPKSASIKESIEFVTGWWKDEKRRVKDQAMAARTRSR